MASFNKFNSFVEAIAEGKHNLGSDQLKVALSNTVPVATNSVLADIAEIDYSAGLSSRNIVTTSSSQTGGTYKLVLTDLELLASGTLPAFRYVILYNDTAANDELIGWFDNDIELILRSGDTFTLDMNPTTGILTLQ